MERVRIGIIGLGIMGELYARIYSAHPLAELVAVSTRREERLAEIAERTGVKHTYTDYRKMLERPDLDAVVIATPDFLHFEPTRDALESGRHVLVEKPFTTHVDEADELLRIAHRKGRKIQVAFNHRWLPPYQQAKSTLASGKIGRPLAAYARKNDTVFVPTEYITWPAQTTPAWFLSSHDVDLIRWLLDDEAVEARALGRKEVLAARGIPTYDVIQAQVKFSSGAFATFESAWIYPNTFPSIVDSFVEVLASDGHIHLDRKYESIEVSSKDSFTYPKGFLTCEVFGRLRGAFPSCLEDFLFAIRDDTTPHVTGLDGRQVTAALEAIHKSLETGNAEPVQPLPHDLPASYARG
ncbi:MAG TPA: Gfo/Idh/MocA family oxidoreductase [Terriglobia bacterium]|nr:Gfo/Idh/MocA family oxidoreductase [Terriglobia bacterium]